MDTKKKTALFPLWEWVLEPTGWILNGDSARTTYALRELDDDTEWYKRRWNKEKSTVNTEDDNTKNIIIEQQLIVSYSIKYRDYLRSVRWGQSERVGKMVKNGNLPQGRKDRMLPRSFIKTDSAIADGEVAEQSAGYIDQEAVANEEQFDSFYAVCTNLDDNAKNIIRVNVTLAAHICRIYLCLTAETASIDVMALPGKKLAPIRNDCCELSE